MSLVIAFIGTHVAVMGGDTREIITSGDRISTETLEHELYTGLIVTDDAFQQRAAGLGVSLTIRDDKKKVTQRDGILVGEVSETEAGVTRKRRLYATAGEYALAEITSDGIRMTRKGNAGTFVVLGNQITQQIAHSCIREHGKNITMHDAVRIIMLSMKRASDVSASVSLLFDLIQTPLKVSLSEVIEQDSIKCR
ncbi:MAG: DUF2121 domain-containing protein [Methanoregula sp.]|jgi:hypothetical protein